MNRNLIAALCVATFGLAACNPAPSTPAVVTVPGPTVAVPVPTPVPGPAGPQGATGATGATGDSGSGTTVVVTPPAPAASN